MPLTVKYRFGMRLRTMNAFQAALTAYLDASGATHSALAEASGTSQANITRYTSGRLPSRLIAEAIDRATGGQVSLSVWQIAKAERVGITAQAA